MKLRFASFFWISLLFGWSFANSVGNPEGKYIIRRVIRRVPQQPIPQYDNYQLYENRNKRQAMPDFMPEPMNQVLFNSQPQPYPINQKRRRRNLKTKRRIPISKRRKRLISQVNTPTYNSDAQNPATQWNQYQYPVNPGGNQFQPYVILLPAQAQNPNFWKELGYGANGNVANNIQPLSPQVPQLWNNMFGAGQTPGTQIVPTNSPAGNLDFPGMGGQRDSTSLQNGQKLDSPISANGANENNQQSVSGRQVSNEIRPLEVYTRPYHDDNDSSSSSSSSSSQEDSSNESKFHRKLRGRRYRRQYDSEDSDDYEDSSSSEEYDDDYDIPTGIQPLWQNPLWPAPAQVAPNMWQNQAIRMSEPVAVKTVNAAMSTNSSESKNGIITPTPSNSKSSSNPKQNQTPLHILTKVISDEDDGPLTRLPRTQGRALPQNQLGSERNQYQDERGQNYSPSQVHKHSRPKKNGGIKFPIILNEDGTWKIRKSSDEYEDSYDDGQLVNGT